MWQIIAQFPAGPKESRVFNVVLFEPEIPPNTGNAIRLCANTGAALHLVGRLGFEITEPRLRRAGLDYHEMANVRQHATLTDCLAAIGPTRLFVIETGGSLRHTDAAYQPGDSFLFGPESRGLSPELIAQLPPHARITLPMRPGNRSLNLSNAVAVTVFEAWRQQGFAGSAG
jgi:tRNA (cytidine/uridine-2'-O-)-methyltransferase